MSEHEWNTAEGWRALIISGRPRQRDEGKVRVGLAGVDGRGAARRGRRDEQVDSEFTS
jgi:hypothetical protein